MDKEIIKNQNRTKLFVAIMRLIGIVIGPFGMNSLQNVK